MGHRGPGHQRDRRRLRRLQEGGPGRAGGGGLQPVLDRKPGHRAEVKRCERREGCHVKRTKKSEGQVNYFCYEQHRRFHSLIWIFLTRIGFVDERFHGIV